MNLRELFINVLREQGEEEQDPVDDTVIEFPYADFSVSFFREQKRILLIPHNKESLSDSAKAFVEIMKEKFRISEEQDREVGTFEIVFDPREDFESVISFMLDQIDLEAGLT